MADIKTLNTRVKLKFDTLANWTNGNPVLLKGEIALVEIPSGSNDKDIHNEPTILMKVGDGTKAFTELGWVSATAADVYGWAKAAEKPVYTADEITGLGAAISEYVGDTMGITVDTNTVYKIVITDNKDGVKLYSKAAGDADSTWVPVGDAISFTAFVKSIATGATNGTISVDGTDVAVKGLGSAAFVNTDAFDAAGAAKAVADQVGTVAAGKTVVEMITDAQTAATYNDSALVGRVTTIENDYLKAADKTVLEAATTAVADELAKQKDASQSGSLAYQIAAEKARMDTFMSAADVTENAVDTLKEIQDYISNDGTAAAKMVTDISANKSAIEAEATRATGVESGLETRLTAVEGKFTGDDSVATQIATAVTAAKTEVKGGSNDASSAETIAGAKKYADEKAAAAQTAAEAASATALNTAKTELEGKINAIHTFENESVLDGISAAKVSNWDAAQTNIIEKVTMNGVEVPVQDKTVALTSNVKDLVQDTNTYIILDCGTATSLI